MSLGERLKKTREDAGLTLKKFADASKIQIKYLERLEGGDYDKLPAFVYIQGFLHRYAEILNLPLDELIADCENETRMLAAEKQKVLRVLPTLPSPRIVITPKKITWAALALVFVLIAGYLFYQFDFLIAPPKLAVSYPADDLIIERTTVEVIGESDPTAKLTINGQQVFIGKDGGFKQEINLSPGLNTLNIEASNRFGKSTLIIRRIIVK
ncbi:MAG: helix-turn-helix domain-containing protein [bacterium]